MTQKFFFSILAFFISMTLGFAQGTTTAADDKAPQFKWTETTHNFGTIEQNKPVTASFEFVNSGKQPLIIQSAKGSCGCTGVKHPTEPIAPGEKGTITATFNAAAVGAFHKSVTVTANVADQNVMLFIKGEVTPTPVQSNVPATEKK